MKIAIDLNDVIRDYSDNFLKTYIMYYNHEYNVDDFELWTNDMEAILPFKNERAYQNFVYVDYTFELFGKCDVCSRKLATELNTWINGLSDIETEEPLEVIFVSPMEYGSSINYSYFFISKLGCQVREVYFPKDSSDIWNRCDVVITANPKLLETKPEGKISIKINKEYNNESESDLSFKSLSEFITNNKNIEDLITK